LESFILTLSLSFWDCSALSILGKRRVVCAYPRLHSGTFYLVPSNPPLPPCFSVYYFRPYNLNPWQDSSWYSRERGAYSLLFRERKTVRLWVRVARVMPPIFPTLEEPSRRAHSLLKTTFCWGLYQAVLSANNMGWVLTNILDARSTKLLNESPGSSTARLQPFGDQSCCCCRKLVAAVVVLGQYYFGTTVWCPNCVFNSSSRSAPQARSVRAMPSIHHLAAVIIALLIIGATLWGLISQPSAVPIWESFCASRSGSSWRRGDTHHIVGNGDDGWASLAPNPARKVNGFGPLAMSLKLQSCFLLRWLGSFGCLAQSQCIKAIYLLLSSSRLRSSCWLGTAVAILWAVLPATQAYWLPLWTGNTLRDCWCRESKAALTVNSKATYQVQSSRASLDWSVTNNGYQQARHWLYVPKFRTGWFIGGSRQFAFVFSWEVGLRPCFGKWRRWGTARPSWAFDERRARRAFEHSSMPDDGEYQRHLIDCWRESRPPRQGVPIYSQKAKIRLATSAFAS